eukprot:14278584-Alexandrium_andersonii.AAC.1
MSASLVGSEMCIRDRYYRGCAASAAADQLPFKKPPAKAHPGVGRVAGQGARWVPSKATPRPAVGPASEAAPTAKIERARAAGR